MQLETIYHMQVIALLQRHMFIDGFMLCQDFDTSMIFKQEMTKREYVEDQDAEDPDDFIISLTTQVLFSFSFV